MNRAPPAAGRCWGAPLRSAAGGAVLNTPPGGCDAWARASAQWLACCCDTTALCLTTKCLRATRRAPRARRAAGDVALHIATRHRGTQPLSPRLGVSTRFLPQCWWARRRTSSQRASVARRRAGRLLQRLRGGNNWASCARYARTRAWCDAAIVRLVRHDTNHALLRHFAARLTWLPSHDRHVPGQRTPALSHRHTRRELVPAVL